MAVDAANLAIVEAEITKLDSESASAIADLKAAASSYLDPQLSQAGFDNNPTWTLPDGKEIAMAGIGDLPIDKPDLDIPAFIFNPEDYINSDLLQKYSYVSAFYDDVLEPKLVQLIQAESYFISQTVQDALFNQTQERDLQILNDEVDAIDRKMASRGFPSVDSILQAARSEAIARWGDRKSDRNREITALIAERAHDGMKHAITQGNAMEQVQSQFQLEFGRLYWNAAQYIISQWEADVKAKVAEYQGEIELIKTKTSVDESNVNFDFQYAGLENQQQLARLSGHVQEMTSNLSAWQTSAEQKVAAMKDALDYYRGNMESALGVLNDVAFKDETT